MKIIFMLDVLFKQEPPEVDFLPDTPQTKETTVPSGRGRRKRKMVNKTFIDESGFMVTKKEYESCSESEEEKLSPAQQPPPPTKPSTSSDTKSPKKVALTTSNNRKQATIMNFFTKK
jgi:DNA polymerase delta subunit 3